MLVDTSLSSLHDLYEGFARDVYRSCVQLEILAIYVCD